MSPIEVIYENGVFRPLEPVELPEGTHVEVIVIRQPQTQAAGSDQTPAEVGPLVGEELVALLELIDSLPFTSADDGRTDISEHHDDILYPKQGKMP